MESSRCLDPSSPWEPWALSELFPGSRPAVTPWLLLAVFPWPFARRSAFAFSTLGPTFWPSQLAPKELIAIMILIESKFIQTAPKHWLFSHKKYIYIYIHVIAITSILYSGSYHCPSWQGLCKPRSRRTRRSRSSGHQRQLQQLLPPRGGWKWMKMGDCILGTLNIGMPAASVTSNIASVASNIIYIYILIYLFIYIYLFIII